VNTFSSKVSSLNESRSKEQKLPSPYCMKSINACWLRRIKELRDMISENGALRNRKSDLFFKHVSLTKELDGPNLFMDTMILTKESLMGQLKALKVVWDSEFIETIKFYEDEVERLLVRYINRNDEVDDTLHPSELDMMELESELFDIKTKHEITMAPLREYIGEWLKKELIEVTEPENQEIVRAVMPPQQQHLTITVSQT
jgi:hypothetical protein